MSPIIGFDCSGLVRFLVDQLQFPLDPKIRHSNEFFDQAGVLVHWGLHLPGDLVFFTYRGLAPRHMGIVLDQSSYIHAPGLTGSEVKISELKLSPIQDLPPDARYSTNPIGFKRLSVTSGRWQRFI